MTRSYFYFMIIISWFVSNSVCWGTLGHGAVGRLAQQRLRPDVNATVVKLLQERFNKSLLFDISSWADKILSDKNNPDFNKFQWSKAMHYMNVDQKLNTNEINCTTVPCIITAIQNFTSILINPSSNLAICSEALAFLVHFVADIHQPLHCAFSNDSGGNKVFVNFTDSWVYSLHGIWDTEMLKKLAGPDDNLFPFIENEINLMTLNQLASYADSNNVIQWAEESFNITKSQVYGFMVSNSTKYQGIIDNKYYNQSVKIAIQRIIIAGIRLSSLLNTIFQNGLLCGPNYLFPQNYIYSAIIISVVVAFIVFLIIIRWAYSKNRRDYEIVPLQVVSKKD